MAFKKLFMLIAVLLLFPSPGWARKIPLPQDLGHVRLNNFTEQAGMERVEFQHWRHRAKFTCRLCHIDIGFAMERKATGINAELNMQGLYCGACHDGKRVIDDTVIFASCAENYNPEEGKRCVRCHVQKTKKQREIEFQKFAGPLPRLKAGNLVDWERAEEEGDIQLVDFLEGISFKRDPMKVQKDFSIEVTTWASDVIFSHKKHAVWNGCELCHPLIFPSSKKGTVKYSMFQIMRGEYCGICHIKVSFPLWFCHKCHKNPVRQ